LEILDQWQTATKRSAADVEEIAMRSQACRFQELNLKIPLHLPEVSGAYQRMSAFSSSVLWAARLLVGGWEWLLHVTLSFDMSLTVAVP
jgi:hypothetical protein